MAMAMPPSVMVLMLEPNPFSANTVTMSEIGMASSVMRLDLMLARNAITTKMTMMPPSRSASMVL